MINLSLNYKLCTFVKFEIIQYIVCLPAQKISNSNSNDCCNQNEFKYLWMILVYTFF